MLLEKTGDYSENFNHPTGILQTAIETAWDRSSWRSIIEKSFPLVIGMGNDEQLLRNAPLCNLKDCDALYALKCYCDSETSHTFGRQTCQSLIRIVASTDNEWIARGKISICRRRSSTLSWNWKQPPKKFG